MRLIVLTAVDQSGGKGPECPRMTGPRDISQESDHPVGLIRAGRHYLFIDLDSRLEGPLPHQQIRKQIPERHLTLVVLDHASQTFHNSVRLRDVQF